MAEEKEPIETAETEPAEKSRGFNLVSALKIVGFLVVVVGIECAVAMLVFPSAAETQAKADAMLGQSASGDMLPVEPEVVDEFEEANKVEVDLTEFHIAAHQPLSNTTLQIDFHLYATVLTDDEPKFKMLLEAKEQRLRDQVITAVRSANMDDFTDAGLGLLKRKILDTSNRTLGEAVLQEIIFSDFSWVER